MKKYTNKEMIKRIEKAKKDIKSLPKVKSKKKIVTWIDLPSGHKYSFPRIIPDNTTDFRSWAVSCGYPEKDIDFGMKYCRMWEEEVDVPTERIYYRPSQDDLIIVSIYANSNEYTIEYSFGTIRDLLDSKLINIGIFIGYL